MVVLLHGDNLLNVVTRSKDTGELCLVEDEVHGAGTHLVEKANRGVIVIHVSDVRGEPLPTIRRPQANEGPIFTVTARLSH